MKSSFALAAAVLVALGGGASAKSKTETISLDGHCDVLTLQIDKNAVAGVDVPTCAHGFGAGFIGKIKGFGNALVAGVQFSEEPGVQLVFRVQYPLVTGGAWDVGDERRRQLLPDRIRHLHGRGHRGQRPARRDVRRERHPPLQIVQGARRRMSMPTAKGISSSELRK